MCFLDRQAVLQVLADHILDSDKILLKKRVLQVEHRVDGVTVKCDDASSYYGDIVVGADGAYSIVRREMWRTANAVAPGDISEKEQNNIIT